MLRRPGPHPAIRIGLKQVKGICKADLESIRAARAEGPFTSLEDFCRRTTVPRDVVENLILAGAFDSLDPSRRRLLWQLETALRCRVPVAEEAQLAFFPCLTPGPSPPTTWRGGTESTPLPGCCDPEVQTSTRLDATAPGRDLSHPSPRSLWRGAGGEDTETHPHTPDFPAPTPHEIAQWEVETLGLTVRAHPVALFRERLAEYRPLPAAEVARCPDGKRVRVAGVVLCRMRPPTKRGTVVVFITLEDETGVIDTVIFPRVYEEYGKAAFASDLLVIEGRVQKQGKRGLAFIAEKVFNPLEGVVEDRIDGKTGLARRELPLPLLGPVPVGRDYCPTEEDPFHPQYPDPLEGESPSLMADRPDRGEYGPDGTA